MPGGVILHCIINEKPTSRKKLEILPNTNTSTTYYIARSLSENIAMTKKVKVAHARLPSVEFQS